jgi:transcriptional regulator GlxA family with amidase domain
VTNASASASMPASSSCRVRGRTQGYAARTLVVYLKGAGGQSHYSALLAAQATAESEVFAELERWIAEHLREDLRVEALAERVHMSPRNFARTYADKRGRTPAKAVEAIRVDAARQLLEQTADRIEFIAAACGFGTDEQMRCAFLRVVRVPPREYRKRFSSSLPGGAKQGALKAGIRHRF